MKKTGTYLAVLGVILGLAVQSAAAFDLQTAENRDDIQFKKELIYTMSKADALLRSFQSEGLTETITSAVMENDNIRYVVACEPRYADLWSAITREATDEQ